MGVGARRNRVAVAHEAHFRAFGNLAAFGVRSWPLSVGFRDQSGLGRWTCDSRGCELRVVWEVHCFGLGGFICLEMGVGVCFSLFLRFNGGIDAVLVPCANVSVGDGENFSPNPEVCRVLLGAPFGEGSSGMCDCFFPVV